MSSAAQLLARARARTGLSDFGDDSFGEGLEVLVGALESEAHPPQFRRAGVYAQIVRHLCNRLEIEDCYRRHPEIEREQIVAPLFGVGLPRSGSTVLLSLLAADPEFRSLWRWEAAQPCSPIEELGGNDPRPRMAADALRMIDLRAPGFKLMLPFASEGPVECLELLALDFRSYFFQLFVHSPRYQQWFLNCDMRPAYRYHRRVLKLLQWSRRPARWQLKSPAHIFSLDALLAVYPDAHFWMSHRDPARAIPSFASLEVELQKVYGGAQAADYGRFTAKRWALGMERALATRKRIGEQRFFDLRFADLQADPLGCVRGLYRWLGRAPCARAEQRMRTWLEGHPRDQYGRHRYQPADFGLSAAALRERFGFYVGRFGLAPEGAEPPS